MKIACIYHRVDLDGWMSAAIVKHWFGTSLSTLPKMTQIGTDEFPAYSYQKSSLSMIGYHYGDPIPDLSEYDKVIMCDVSFSLDNMMNIKGILIWIDHHISAIKENHSIDSITEGLRDTNFAACELTWKYFFPNETMPEIVRLLGRYDCFGHKGTEEEQKVLEFQCGARQVISNYEDAYHSLQSNLQLGNSYCDEILLIGKPIYQYLLTETKQTYQKGFEIIFYHKTFLNIGDKFKVDFSDEEFTVSSIQPNFKSSSGYCYYTKESDNKSYVVSQNIIGNNEHMSGRYAYRFICVNRERFNPINFGIDYHSEGYDGAACFWYSNGKWQFSLYNDNGEVDCSVIAKQFGGGGHKGAAGFVCDTETLLKIINAT